MKQTATIRQTTHLAPQQILVAKMVQATSDELEQLIMAETEKNLALEVTEGMGDSSVEDDYGDKDLEADDALSAQDAGDGSDEEDALDAETMTDNSSKEDAISLNDDEDDGSSPLSADNASYSPLLNYANDATFQEELLDQLGEMELSDDELFLARFLVNSLDDSGYLTRSLPELVDDLAFTQMYETTEEALERVLVDVVQSLEPTGIGARNLQECLLLQLQEMKGSPAVQLAYDIVSKAFDDLSARRLERLCQRFKVTTKQLADAQRIIAHLDPKPGGQSASSNLTEARASHVKPDFSIHNDNGALEVTLNDYQIPSVRISPDYQIILERIQQSGSQSEDSKQGLSMIKESISSGNQFIDALRQRRETLSKVITVIAQMQSNYFLSGGNSD